MIRLLCFLLVFAVPATAQDFSGLARIDMSQSSLRQERGDLVLDLGLSQTVPYRVFTLDDPKRLIVDFREVDWAGVSAEALLTSPFKTTLRFGTLRPGWSRIVVDLAEPLVLDTAGLAVDPQTGLAQLTVRLTASTDAEFAASAGTISDAIWDDLIALPTLPAPAQKDGPLVVVLDPGHGGIDPGAGRGDVHEADLMLSLAIEVADALNRSGDVRAILTRDGDYFVPLEQRVTIARAAGADLFVSLHADALEEGRTNGASVYTLSQDGAGKASARMAERHERGDLLAGLDLSDQSDRVATVLMDLARQETGPAGLRFADALVDALRDEGARLNGTPRRSGRFAVLNSADFPSVLVEAGFLSSDRDRQLLSSAEGRSKLVAGLVRAVQVWALEEQALDGLKRQ